MKFNTTIFLLLFNISLFSQSEFKLVSLEDISKVQIRSNVFDLMSKFQMNFGDKDWQPLIDQLKNLNSIESYSSSTLLGSTAIESSFNDYVLNSDLSQLAEFNEKDYLVNIYALENKDLEIEEISMLVKNSNKLNTIYLQIRGEIDLLKIVEVVNKLDIPGGDFLKNFN